MHKEWAVFKASKKKAAEGEARVAQLRAKLEADQAKFENDRKTEEWSVAGWKRKAEAEAALISEERKNWKKICEKDNAEKMNLRNVINNLKAEVEKLKKQDAEIEKLKKEKADAEVAQDETRSHRERSEQREFESAKKDLELTRTEKAETSRRLAETEEKLETSEPARATTESELKPLKSVMSWLKERGITSVVESVLNSEELEKSVARLLVAARNDGYAQGYAEGSHHVVNALKVDWNTSKFATHDVNTDVALADAKTEFNNLQLPVLDLINVALQSEDHVAQLKEIFPDGENEDEDLAYVFFCVCMNN
ncbi:calponin homology domain-containing protein DDB_G0272472-like [Helianthus annuus]|uniref:calponin homology domain-containing protein DDB_G0272472-like n=1 Tax=Helianthus annuus TaxID=4232 RepID=UPI000B905A5B|nr:calponin homology domain-containing protein DDB_G0272472-like [Helianthus annuus]